jgi:hypothetical protein
MTYKRAEDYRRFALTVLGVHDALKMEQDFRNVVVIEPTEYAPTAEMQHQSLSYRACPTHDGQAAAAARECGLTDTAFSEHVRAAVLQYLIEMPQETGAEHGLAG